MRLLAALTSAPVIAAVALAAQQPPSPQPPQVPAASFRTGIDLLTVQTAVVDRDGRPVTDLRPEDFAVTVDGRARKVLFARFYGLDAARAGSTPAGAPAVVGPVVNTQTAAGRIVIFVVDRDSIRTGSEKAVFETASRVLEALTPADAVGLIGVPTGAVELTREHARVKDALKTMTGTEPRLLNGNDRYLTWDEATAFERNDRTIMASVIERECPVIARSEPGPPDRCPQLLRDQAREVLQVGRGHVRTTLSILGSLAKRLETVRGSKHVILISGGKAFDMDLAGDYKEFAERAAAAQIVLYAVHLDQPTGDVVDRRVSGSAFGGRDMSSGLTTMAGMTGGAYLSAVARATGVFDRIRTEISNFYELGVETLPGDVDGRPHGIDVKVTRSGVSVRARQQVVVPASVTLPQGDPLLALLQQPTDIAEIPLAVATYTTRGDQPDSLKVLVSARIGADSARAPAEWAFVVFDRAGRLAADGRQTVEAGTAHPWLVTASAQLAPGQYRLKLAANDAERRAGVIDLPLTVGLRAAGPLQMSDLILGVNAAGRMQPRVDIPQGTALTALIELMSNDASQLANGRVVLEVIPAGGDEPVQRVLMAARSSGSETVLLNEARIDTGTLPAGRYTASAVALVANQPVGRVSRVFELVTGG